MSRLQSLTRSTPSIHQRLSVRHLSTAPQPSSSSLSSLITASSLDSNPHQNPSYGSFIKWISGFAVGSGLGLLYWSSPNSVLTFADWSTVVPGETLEDPPSRSLSQKLSLPEITPRFLFGDAYRRKIFFNYEKRIRLRSPPEKVFEYFASSSTQEGELLMRPEDLMRAVVPVFPPSESHLVRDGYLRGERNPGDLRCSPSEFFMLFDVNNDGHISFKEYIFFVTLLSIPESSFYVAFKMFDTDDSGKIDKEEFKKVMALMRACNRQGANHRHGIRTGLKFNGSVENGGLVEYFFGKDGKDCLQLDKFVKFLRDLQDEMVRLEFAHYDYKLRGTILAKDFALSMVASADMTHLSNLLNRVDELNNKPHLKDVRITFEEFKNFAELRKKLQPLSLALFSYGKANGMLTREDFQRAASHVCGVSLTDNVVEIIFHVFDSNRDGNLSLAEFFRVLHQRGRDIAQHVDTGIMVLD
ncbi:calcium uptake protein, mitochondrial-like isoform X1 [Prunus avium]|uniref:Calcium uptake protein, mitochondrial-like isoform X1 n=1 Tax=Prunus avium TaxID=42229 RepID=A0A6P5TE97_PRUAV|nr:calcium uptake protein, mitochondrial-like isoform X1 [Prunus avium]